MRPRVVVLDDWEGAIGRLGDWSAIRLRADVAIERAALRGEALLAALVDAEVVVVTRDRTAFDADLTDRLPKLRYLVFTGPRNRRIDYAALAARDIPVSSTDGGPALESTAEHTWALILASARDLEAQFTTMRAGGWKQDGAGPLPRVLSGRTLGLIGCGRIGARVARYGKAFGMDVVTWSPNMTAARADQAGARAVSLEELLATALVVSLHLVASPATRGLLDRDRLARMRSDALLVNTARAELVDMPALAEALEHGRLAGAALDVFPDEPLAPDDPLRRLANITITPHTGFGSEPVFAAFARGAVACVSAWLAGQALPRVVDVAALTP